MRLKTTLLALSLTPFFTLAVQSQTGSAATSTEVNTVFPDAKALYLDLHQHPELSSHETRTAAELASRLKALGYEVTEHVGGTGVVGIMKNGAGPTVMLRTELDALPVEEKTGLPYASKVHTKDDSGQDVPVMHACGHDLHMSSWIGTATVMAHSKDTWHGTLMLIAQPAEETITGAKKMLDDGLFTRFAKPDLGISLHDDNRVPVGKIGITNGYAMANSDSLKVTVFGHGGHGSAPETTIDPVLIAARIVVTLQSIVAREVHPGDAAVITVGYIKGGLKNNIIPDQVEMGLTVRSYKKEVREHLLSSIARVVKAEAEAAGADKMPTIDHPESTMAVYNDPKLAGTLRPALESALGKENVIDMPAVMGSEDYSFFVDAGVPSMYFTLGAADPQKLAEATAAHKTLPSLHSSLFAPVIDPALHTGIAAEVAALRAALK